MSEREREQKTKKGEKEVRKEKRGLETSRKENTIERGLGSMACGGAVTGNAEKSNMLEIQMGNVLESDNGTQAAWGPSDTLSLYASLYKTSRPLPQLPKPVKSVLPLFSC